MSTTSGADEHRLNQRRVTAAWASGTHPSKLPQTRPRQDDVEHDPGNGHCLCPTCHLKMAQFPRRHDGRILLPPPVPFHKARAHASGPPMSHTQPVQFTGSECCGTVDRSAPAPGMGPGKGCRSSPAPQSSRNVPSTVVPSFKRDRTVNTIKPAGSTVRSHATEPYPSGVQPRAQRHGKQRELSASRTSNRKIAQQSALPSEVSLAHERQPRSQFLESLPQLGIIGKQPGLDVLAEVSLERHGPAFSTTSRSMLPSYRDAILPNGPPIASGSRDDAAAATSMPLSPPTDRPLSRFFRFRPELFDQNVEDNCDPKDGESSTGAQTAAIPEPSTSQGAGSPQPLLHIAHYKGPDVVSERIDVDALSFRKAVTPPKEPAPAKTAASSSRVKRNRSSDKDASGSAVNVKWDSERKRRQGYFAQDDGNEKSPFRHYNQTSCNFGP